jgi:superfamily II DNA/RNA helicase
MLWEISRLGNEIDWEQRGQVVDAINRAFLRDHFLLRLPREVFSGKDDLWSEALVRGFHAPLFGKGSEPVASKVEDFLSGLVRMTKDERQHSLKYSLNAQAKAVVLVSGPTKERDAVFRGFNSPLLPEILICTEVGQEGIDLHRHCRHVVHYDLGWNPAKIEQRTGRIDRIGSKTQRERNLNASLGEVGDEITMVGLEVALPYLAATYDERMFDRLFARAQAFDLLTGGDASAEEDDERQSIVENIGAPDGRTNLVVLPESLKQALRVDLRASKQTSSDGCNK